MLPLWLKLVQTAVVAVVVPTNWRQYGARNFLWFSDVALLLMLPAVWLESAPLTGAAALSALALEIVWDADFLCVLLLRRAPLGLAGYMLNEKIPLWMRSITLFHLWLQAAMLLSLRALGYDPRALPLQTVVCWLVLPAAARLATPDENIDWALGPGGRPPWGLSQKVWVALAAALLPLCVYLPTHLVLKALF
jgi:hypothetical protein